MKSDAVTESELESMAASDQKQPKIDQETLRAYNAYLKDWRWDMSTHITLQREYMGRSHYPRNENLF